MQSNALLILIPYQEEKKMANIHNQAMNRRIYDTCKTSDDLRVSTGPGRYQLNPPSQQCNSCYVSNPTIRQQRGVAPLNSTYMKTDVESDLLNMNRPTSKTVCNQYNPTTNKMNTTSVVQPQECEFPQIHSRLVDPPCTLRSSGWNRWEWLCQNPQEGVMTPFDNLVTTRLAAKDSYRPCIPTPVQPHPALPTPTSYNPSDNFSNLEPRQLMKVTANYPIPTM